MSDQQDVSEELVTSWRQSAKAFAGDVATIEHYYLYGYQDAHTSFADGYFEQAGEIRTSTMIEGQPLDVPKCFALQRQMRNALETMTTRYEGLGLRPPIEVRVKVTTATNAVETELLLHSSFLIDDVDPAYGIVSWLGDRAPDIRLPYGPVDNLQDLAQRGIAVLKPRFPHAEFGVVALPADNAVFVYPQIRGGGTLIVANDRSMLFAASAIQFSEALAEFRAGRRSDIKPPAGETTG